MMDEIVDWGRKHVCKDFVLGSESNRACLGADITHTVFYTPVNGLLEFDQPVSPPTPSRGPTEMCAYIRGFQWDRKSMV